MQSHAAKGIDACSVFIVADYRMVYVLHMNADLMFPAGLKIQLEEGKLHVAAQFFIMGNGLFAELRALVGIDDKG